MNFFLYNEIDHIDNILIYMNILKNYKIIEFVDVIYIIIQLRILNSSFFIIILVRKFKS